MCFGILQRSKIEALQKCHGNVKCVSEFSVIHIWVSEFECVLVMISSFHLHLETGVQNDAVTLITPQWQIYSLRCFKRFLSLFIVVFVRIIWCWCFCWCQLWMVGYNFFSSYISHPLISYVFYLHFILSYEDFFLVRALFPFAIIQSLNSKRFPYFHSFSKHFRSLANIFEHWGCLALVVLISHWMFIVYVILPSAHSGHIR